jgi:Fe-S-cluster containining protein
MAENFEMGGKPLFFTFLERQFGYSCDGCHARCCVESGGLSVSQQQAELIEELGCRHLIIGQQGSSILFGLGASVCPALLSNDRCGLHERNGRRAKPSLCALFPFSVLTDAGSFLVVSPHLTFVCPLVLDPPPGYSSPGHAEILDDLCFFFGDSKDVFRPAKPPKTGATTCELESRVLERANALRGTGTVISALAEAAGGTVDDLSARLGRALAFVDAEPLPEDAASSRDVLPLIPSLRVAHLGLEASQIDVAVLVAWNIARRALAAGGPSSVRRVASLFAAASKLAGFASRAHLPVRLEAEPKAPEGATADIVLEVVLIQQDIKKAPGEATLMELVERHVQSTGWRRTLVLQALHGAKLVFDQS